LVIRACAIGDFILNLPALVALHAKYEQAHFSLVGYPATLEIARDFVPIDSINSIETKPWARLFYEPIEELSYDFAVVWMKDALVADNLRRSGVLEVFRADPFPNYGHASTHLLRTLGLAEQALPNLWMPQTGDVIIHPSSGSPKKNWPYFDELTSRIGQSCLSLWERAQGVFESSTPTGGASHTGLSHRERHRMISDLSLPEVSRHLRKCRAFIGNDSGITHLASYLGVPTVALFGPTNPRIWGPIGRRTRIIWKTRLEDISIDEVLQTLQCLIENNRLT